MSIEAAPVLIPGHPGPLSNRAIANPIPANTIIKRYNDGKPDLKFGYLPKPEKEEIYKRFNAVCESMDWPTYNHTSIYDLTPGDFAPNWDDNAFYYCHTTAPEIRSIVGDFRIYKIVLVSQSVYHFCFPCWQTFQNDADTYSESHESEIQEVREKMALPKPPETSQRTNEADAFRSEYGPFLKVATLRPMLDEHGSLVAKIGNRPPNRKAKEAEIKGPAEGQFGVDIPLDVGDERLILSVRTNTGNWSDLFAVFGSEEGDWIGKEIRLSIEESEFTGREFIKAAPVG